MANNSGNTPEVQGIMAMPRYGAFGSEPTCAHGATERTCFTCAAEGPSVHLPSDWKREGMVVVADSMTGKLLGCMGRNTWEGMDRGA